MCFMVEWSIISPRCSQLKKTLNRNFCHSLWKYQWRFQCSAFIKAFPSKFLQFRWDIDRFHVDGINESRFAYHLDVIRQYYFLRDITYIPGPESCSLPSQNACFGIVSFSMEAFSRLITDSLPSREALQSVWKSEPFIGPLTTIESMP